MPKHSYIQAKPIFGVYQRLDYIAYQNLDLYPIPKPIFKCIPKARFISHIKT